MAYQSIYKCAEIDRRLTDVDNRIALPSPAYAGLFPMATAQGGVQWVPRGQPTDAQTAAAISAWLAAHPEATTTVQDGAVTTAKIADGAVTMAKLAGGTYAGVDLTAKFASEVGSDAWAWIRSRIQAANYSGIHIGDYIPFTAGGGTYQAKVAGIDTYWRYGTPAVGRHIDFICDKLWSESHKYNETATNNGTESAKSPWLASDLYGWLNSTVFDTLPLALRAVIVPKLLDTETRYSASGGLTSSAGSAWVELGNLWLPTEVEVYGFPLTGTPYYSALGSIGKYPLFDIATNRVKYTAASTAKRVWWLLNATDGSNKGIACVNQYGAGASASANNTGMYAPICFRIA